ncbi:signal peptidase I [Orbaceae bacterium ac157xtp]
MANYFAILLTLATLITGIFWILERFKFKPARQRKVEAVRVQTDGNIDGKVLAEVGKPSKTVDFFASLFPVLFLVFFIRSFVVEPYQIPSGSMMPTLLVGDFIAVQKYSYGIKDPITNTTLIKTGSPQRGDVAVFKDPTTPGRDLVKRVIGVPGDKVVYDLNSKILKVYPACSEPSNDCVAGHQLKSIPINYSNISDSDWNMVFGENSLNFHTNEELKTMNLTSASNDVVNLKTRKEMINDKSHDTLIVEYVDNGRGYYKQQGQKLGVWVVPEGQYFMMGDNRDNSADSRFWGFAPEESFIGRASIIWISFDKQPDEWPTGIRFSHLGSVN